MAYLSRRANHEPLLVVTPDVVAPGRPTPLQPVTLPVEEGARLSATGARLDAPLEDAAAPEQTDSVTFAGRLVFEDTFEPAAEHDVWIASLAKRTEWASTRSDADGAFALELVPGPWREGELHEVTVAGPTQAIGFRGTVPATGDVLLLVRRPALAHGRLDLVPPCVEPADLVLTILRPANERQWGDQRLGECDVQESGSFALPVAPGLEPAELELVLGSRTLPGLVVVRVRGQELVSPEGAEVAVGLTKLTIHTRDANGLPVRGVKVQILPARGRSDLVAPLSMEVDSSGSVTALVATGETTAVAWAAGFRCASRSLDLRACSETAVLVLHPLRAPALRGRVETADGRPAGDARVTVHPPRGAVAELLALATTHTDEAGEFALERPEDGPLALYAFHEDHGSAVHPAVPPETRRLLVVLEPEGGVHLRLVGGCALAAIPGGVPEYALAAVDRQRLYRGELGADGLIEAVAEGSYNAFLRLAGGECVGRAFVEVRAGKTTEVSVPVQAATAFRGRVLTEEGVGAAHVRLTVVDPRWPEALRENWGTTTTDAEGAFLLLAGAEERLEVELATSAGVVHRCALYAGKPSTYVLPATPAAR